MERETGFEPATFSLGRWIIIFHTCFCMFTCVLFIVAISLTYILMTYIFVPVSSSLFVALPHAKVSHRCPMPKLFTEREIKALKPRDKEFIISEGHGFIIRVLPTGLKIWTYKYKRDGKTYKLTLGNYPETSLAEARDKFAAARLTVRQGLDPKAPLAPEPQETQTEVTTVKTLAELWIKWSQENHSPKWANTLKLALEKDIIPQFGDRLAAEIRRRDAISILEAKAADTPGQAVNLHKALRGMFQYAVEREILEHNPFAEIRAARSIPAMRLEARERILSDDEIKFLWTAIDQGGGSDSTQRALKVMLLTGQRSGEVCGMHRREITIGVGKPRCDICRRCGWWTIPKERRQGNKGGEHRVYLTAATLNLIGSRAEYIFPGDTESASISANSVNHHVRRVVTATGKASYYGLLRWTPHDLRRTCGTGVRRCGGSRDTMDLILGHKTGGVTGVYDRYEGDAEKQKWLTEWAEYLHKLLTKAY